MRILIVGVSGYIGSNIARWMKENTDYFIAGTYYSHEPKVAIDTCMQLDFSDKYEEIDNVGYDVLIHAAGSYKEKSMKEYIKKNVTVTENVISLAEKLGVKQIIYLSTVSVYGSTDDMVYEKSDRKNLSDYGLVKTVCEKMVEESNIKSRVIIQLPGVVGGYCSDLSRPWLPLVVRKLIGNEKIEFYSPNSLYNSIVYVDDIAHFINILLVRQEFCGTFVLGAVQPMKIIEILEMLKRDLKSVSEFEEKKKIRNNCSMVDCSKALKNGFRKRKVSEILRYFAGDVNKRIL